MSGRRQAACSNLSSVAIPTSVTKIEDEAFSDCVRLKAIYFKGNAPGAGFGVFGEDSNAIIYYLPGATGWGPTFAGRPTVLSAPF